MMSSRLSRPVLKWYTLAAALVLALAYAGAGIGLAWMGNGGTVVGLSGMSVWWSSRDPTVSGGAAPGWHAWRYVDRIWNFWIVYDMHGSGSTSLNGDAPGFHRVLLWPFAVVVVPTLVFTWWGVFRRLPENCCQRCGYEMSGVPAADGTSRCPECGTAVTIQEHSQCANHASH